MIKLKIEIINKYNKDTIELDLSQRGLTNLPPNIYKFKNLAYLYLHKNLLKILSPKISHSLKLLSVYHNLLNQLPPEIGEFTNLTELILSDNLLKYIPTIKALKKLFVLEICNNKLKFLPLLPENIERLYVDGNKILFIYINKKNIKMNIVPYFKVANCLIIFNYYDLIFNDDI